MRFRNRAEAGRILARSLDHYKNKPDVLVLGLPRGGVPVAYEVARALNAPLDVFIVRKLGLPGHEELAMGAIATGNVRVLNDAVVRQFKVSPESIDEIAAEENAELHRRQELYRGDRPDPQISGRTVIVVDDGLATGATMKVALTALRLQNPAKIVAAVPAGAPETCHELTVQADEVVCTVTPQPFYAVGLWYDDFRQIEDVEVTDLIRRAA